MTGSSAYTFAGCVDAINAVTFLLQQSFSPLMTKFETDASITAETWADSIPSQPQQRQPRLLDQGRAEIAERCQYAAILHSLQLLPNDDINDEIVSVTPS